MQHHCAKFSQCRPLDITGLREQKDVSPKESTSLELLMMILIGPESDHCLALSVKESRLLLKRD